MSRNNNAFIENPDSENISEIISNKITNIGFKIQLLLVFFFQLSLFCYYVYSTAIYLQVSEL